MTKEDKELLLKDLCARLPYGVVINTWYDKRINIKCVGVNVYTNVVELDIPEDDEARVFIVNVKPYLFPLSSMTEEQKQEYTYIVNYINPDDTDKWKEGEFIYVEQFNRLMHFYHINHLDYRGLIEKGLAIDATNKNIY